jgi:hypothetical protein
VLGERDLPIGISFYLLGEHCFAWRAEEQFSPRLNEAAQ